MRVSQTRNLKHFNHSLTGQVLEEVMGFWFNIRRVLWGRAITLSLQCVTLSNNMELSKHIGTMTNKANSKLCFYVATWRAAQISLSKLLTFLWFAHLWSLGPIPKIQQWQNWEGFAKSRYLRYSTVSDMLDVLGWMPLYQRRQEARLILFHKIINGMAQVPFESVIVEAYKDTWRKHSMKFRQIGHTTSQYAQSFSLKLLVHGMGLLSLKLRHWQYLDEIFFYISVHPFRLIP